MQLLACIAVLCVALAQVEVSAQNMITVPLKVGDGLEYEISLLPTVDGVRAISSTFCAERKADFGITDANIDVCLEPVLAYLSQYIPAEAAAQQQQQQQQQQEAEPDMTIPLKVGEQEFDITIQPNADSAVATALSFCQQHGAKFGVTEDTFLENCLNPVGEYLKEAAETEAAARAARRLRLQEAEAQARQLALLPDDRDVPMKIGDLAFSIGWNSARTDARNMAIKFCTEQGEAIGAGFEDCLGPVEKHLTEQAALQASAAATAQAHGGDSAAQAQTQTEERIVKARVDIAGEDFEFRFEPSEADALKVSTTFCRDNGAALGVNDNTVEVQCIRPILKVLLNALEQVQ